MKATSVDESKNRIHSALANEPGPARDIVALNAAGALLAADVVGDWQSGLDLAFKVIASGAAKQKLDAFITTTRSIA